MSRNKKLAISILIIASCTFVCGVKNKSDGIPLIVWWYKTIFPHIEEGGKRSYEVSCHEGVKCYSSNDRAMVSQDGQLAMIFYGSDFQADDLPLPRKKDHMWALLHEESPQNNFILCQEEVLQLFNFTSTFKQNSDYPLTTQHIPSIAYLYERKPVSLSDKNKYRLKGLAPVVYLQSHCDVPSDRDRYVKELMKHIEIDSYGKCIHNKNFTDESLGGMESLHSEELLDVLSKYKFHLAFENAICDDYITEKMYRSLHVGSVPVYMGANNVGEWCPEKSVIEVADFHSPESLAEYLHALDADDILYSHYLQKDKHTLPRKMKEALERRSWSASDPRLPHFVDSFECYVCSQMHKIAAMGEATSSRIADLSHLNCPRPKPSFGDFKHLNADDSIHKWVEFYRQATFQAKALLDVMRNNETDGKILWRYVSKHMMENHEEL